MRDLLTVRETAHVLGKSEELVRVMLRAGDLPAQKTGDGKKAHWRVDGLKLRDQLVAASGGETLAKHTPAENEAWDAYMRLGDLLKARRKARMAGVVSGYGDFPEKMAAKYGPEAGDHARRSRLEQEALCALSDEMAATFAKVDAEHAAEQAEDDAYVEKRARALADEYRRRERAERLRERVVTRALEILGEDDTADG